MPFGRTSSEASQLTNNSGNRPAEIFGYPIGNRTAVAEQARRQHQCPFRGQVCDKKSRLIEYP